LLRAGLGGGAWRFCPFALSSISFFGWPFAQASEARFPISAFDPNQTPWRPLSGEALILIESTARHGHRGAPRIYPSGARTGEL